MPNDTIISNIKKRLEKEQIKQENLKSKKIIYTNNLTQEFNNYFVKKFIDNDFLISYVNDSYHINFTYMITVETTDPALNKNDYEYIVSRFKNKIIEIIGIQNIEITYKIDYTITGLFSRIINLNIDIDISTLLDDDNNLLD